MGWALCIGAGSSRGTKNGVFPEWPDLVDNLITEDSVVTAPEQLASSLKAGFSPDALIEAAKDRLRLSDAAFVDRLQTLLYSGLQRKAGAKWRMIAKCLTAASPVQIKRADWEEFITFFEKTYPHLSALQIARVISEQASSQTEPAAVLSFNAEPLLYALVHACRAVSQPGAKPAKSLRVFNRVTRGISYQEAPRIPYIFCHGLMEIEGGYKIFAKSASIEKLVFSESNYLQLANSAFSWQASLFLGTAVLRSLVFVGVSFSDPNLRRWLAWVHMNRVKELELKGRDTRSWEHFWINRDPNDEAKKLWIESVVRHLGVRLVWIEDWDRIGDYLRRMLIP